MSSSLFILRMVPLPVCLLSWRPHTLRSYHLLFALGSLCRTQSLWVTQRRPHLLSHYAAASEQAHRLLGAASHRQTAGLRSCYVTSGFQIGSGIKRFCRGPWEPLGGRLMIGRWGHEKRAHGLTCAYSRTALFYLIYIPEYTWNTYYMKYSAATVNHQKPLH